MRHLLLTLFVLLGAVAPSSDALAANKTKMAIQTSLIDTVAALNPNGQESEEMSDLGAWGRGIGSHTMLGFRLPGSSSYVGPFLHLERGVYAAPLSSTDAEGAVTYDLAEHELRSGAVGIAVEGSLAKHFRLMLGLGYGLGTATTAYTQSGRRVEVPVRVFCFDVRLSRSFSIGPRSAVVVGLDLRSLGYQWEPGDGAGLFPGNTKPQISSGGFGPSLGYVQRF